MPFVEAAERAEGRFGTLSASGSYTPPSLAGKYCGHGVGPSPAYSYTAAVVQVEGDPDTDWITVPQMWIGHDLSARQTLG
jgi:4-hydroxybenzoyl-CoA reductase subunit alpha